MHGKNKSLWFVNQVLNAIQQIGFKKFNLPSTAIFYLISLAKYADKTGYCCPSQHEIEHFIGLSASHQFRYLSALKECGIITTKTKYSRRYKMNRKHYTIHLDIILNIGIDQNGDVKIEKIETKNECINNERLSKLESHSIDQLSKLESPTIELTTQLKDTNYPTKADLDIVQQKALDDQNLINFGEMYFEEFWAVYPRKEKKKDALKIWARMKLDRIADKIIHDVRMRQIKHDRWMDRAFIPLPTTYLNAESWNDEIIEFNSNKEMTNGSNQTKFKQFNDDLQRAKSELANKYVRAIQDNLGRKVD